MHEAILCLCVFTTLTHCKAAFNLTFGARAAFYVSHVWWDESNENKNDLTNESVPTGHLRGANEPLQYKLGFMNIHQLLNYQAAHAGHVFCIASL